MQRVYMGWYGSCEQCDTFSLTHKDVREKILKVLQITDDNKSYTKFDGTIERSLTHLMVGCIILQNCNVEKVILLF